MFGTLHNLRGEAQGLRRQSRSMAGGRALAGGLLCVLIAVDGLAPGALTWGPSGWKPHSHGRTMLVKRISQKWKKGKLGNLS